jgi:hypothetical protein
MDIDAETKYCRLTFFKQAVLLLGLLSINRRKKINLTQHLRASGEEANQRNQ